MSDLFERAVGLLRPAGEPQAQLLRELLGELERLREVDLPAGVHTALVRRGWEPSAIVEAFAGVGDAEGWGLLRAPIQAHQAGVRMLAYDAQTALLCSRCRDGKVLLWDGRSGEQTGALEVPDGYGEVAMVRREEGLRIATYGGGLLECFDGQAQKLWQRKVPEARELLGAGPEGWWLRGSGALVHVPMTGEVRVLDSPRSGADIYNGGRRAVGCDYNEPLQLIELDGGEWKPWLEGAKAFLGGASVVYAVNAEGVLESSDGRSFDVHTPQNIVRLDLDPEERVLWVLGEERKGFGLGPTTDRRLFRVDLQRAEVSRWELPDSEAESIAGVLPGGEAFFSNARTGLRKLWGREGLEQLLPGQSGTSAFAGDETRIITGDEDGLLWIWAPMRELYG